MARTRAPLNRLVVAAVVLVVSGAVGTALVLLREEPATASGYRITYVVEDLISQRRTTEVLEVDRPRASRRLLDEGGSATTESGVFDRSPQGTWRQLAVAAPGEPGQDLQLLAPLAWAEGERLASRDGVGEVAGEACTWWLTREPLDTAVFAAATATDRARTCVDRTGRLLADTWTVDGREVRRRTATGVTSRVAVSTFDGQAPEPIAAQLITSVVEQIPMPVGDLVRPSPPAEGRLLTSVKVVDIAPGTADVVRRTQRTVYVVDGLLVVLDQVRETAGAPEARGSEEVDLGPLGTGRVRATGAGLVVEARLGDGLVRVRSGVPLDGLLSWLRTLPLGPAS